MDPSQIKQLDDLLVKLSKNQNAYPFLEPVDPIALNIPDYFEKIKNPMDISTIKMKLKQDIYENPEQLKDDMKLMFNNCYTYNHKETAVYKMGMELEKSFNNFYNKMFGQKTVAKRKTIETPVIKKSVRSNMNENDIKHCSDILNEILKPKYQSITWAFMEPINDDIIPGYSNVIKHPTDLSTIKSKLMNNEFISVDDFHKELKMMVDNCFKFNGEVKKIYDGALELEKLIETLFLGENDKGLIQRRLNELQNNKLAIEREIGILEEKIGSKQRMKPIKTYSLEDRLDIGNMIMELNQIQTTRIAQIISKSGVQIDFINKNEVEVDLRLLSDTTLYEIEDYIKKCSGLKGKENELNETLEV